MSVNCIYSGTQQHVTVFISFVVRWTGGIRAHGLDQHADVLVSLTPSMSLAGVEMLSLLLYFTNNQRPSPLSAWYTSNGDYENQHIHALATRRFAVGFIIPFPFFGSEVWHTELFENLCVVSLAYYVDGLV